MRIGLQIGGKMSPLAKCTGYFGIILWGQARRQRISEYTTEIEAADDGYGFGKEYEEFLDSGESDIEQEV